MAHTADGRPLEIERKYLIDFPDLNVIASQPDYSRSDIEQAYLAEGGRVRMRRYFDNASGGEYVRYYKTYKESIGGISRIEVESEITQNEYLTLSERRALGTRVIRKTRHCFTYHGLLFELDIYDFWSDKATLEVELESENRQVELPPFISVLRDVSEDADYTNFALAKVPAKSSTLK